MEKMKFRKGMCVTVVADVNDGDEINETTTISGQVELDEIIKIIKVIPKTDHNWADWELSDIKQQFDEDYMPFMDNEEVHTIESIDIEIIEHVASLL